MVLFLAVILFASAIVVMSVALVRTTSESGLDAVDREPRADVVESFVADGGPRGPVRRPRARTAAGARTGAGSAADRRRQGGADPSQARPRRQPEGPVRRPDRLAQGDGGRGARHVRHRLRAAHLSQPAHLPRAGCRRHPDRVRRTGPLALPEGPRPVRGGTTHAGRCRRPADDQRGGRSRLRRRRAAGGPQHRRAARRGVLPGPPGDAARQGPLGGPARPGRAHERRRPEDVRRRDGAGRLLRHLDLAGPPGPVQRDAGQATPARQRSAPNRCPSRS